MVESNGTRVMLDAGGSLPEIPPDAVLLTHFHLDHCSGLAPLRWAVGEPWVVYAPNDDRRKEVIFGEGGALDFQHPTAEFVIGNLAVTPLPLQHSAPTFGWFLEDNEGTLAYLVDTRGLPESTESFLCAQRIDMLILDCTHPRNHADPNHNNYFTAIETIESLQPARTLLVHVGHDLDCWRFKADMQLPAGAEFARDGQALAVVQGK